MLWIPIIQHHYIITMNGIQRVFGLFASFANKLNKLITLYPHFFTSLHNYSASYDALGAS